MLHAVIMAGGSGTRFWPESRGARPKQLLPLAGPRTMIQATCDRLAGLIPAERLLIVAGQGHVPSIAAQLPELPPESLLGEPCRRDTAPCIGLAALLLEQRDADATMLVMPADHVIQPVEAFQSAARLAANLVDRRPERIVTFGIRPTYPAATFGYIERGQPIEAGAKAKVFQVGRFREKPDVQTAREYLATGNYYWNAGIFVWKARTVLAALAERQPDMLAHLRTIAQAAGTAAFAEVLRREFAEIRGISIDYAVMEQARDVAVIEATFGWDDVGTWQSLARLNGADEQGNTIVARHLGIDTNGTIVRGDADHLIVTLGVRDLIVVHTPGVTLVAHKDQEESIRQVVRQIEERGWTELL
jgi:mannose-1-phosphate guanylyltransferase